MDHFVYKIDSISKSFGALHVLKNITLEIQSGSVVICIGVNGAGKTTFFKILCGLLKADSGSFYKKTAKSSQPSSVDVIGYCPQEISIWPDLTCREQMTMVARLNGMNASKSKEQVNGLLNRLQLTSKADTLASKLSGGMKRRLNLGLALVHEPEFCILDEPLDGVDLHGRKFIRDYINEISSQKKQTIIMSTHIMEEALYLNGTVVLFTNGEVTIFKSQNEFSDRISEGLLMEKAI